MAEEIGVTSQPSPVPRVQALFEDRLMGAVCEGHPFLEGTMTAERIAAVGQTRGEDLAVRLSIVDH